MGTTLREVIFEIGGGIREGRSLKEFRLVGHREVAFLKNISTPLLTLIT